MQVPRLRLRRRTSLGAMVGALGTLAVVATLASAQPGRRGRRSPASRRRSRTVSRRTSSRRRAFEHPTNYINENGWVEAPFDSDFDGKNDRIHFDVTRQVETERPELQPQGSDHLRGQPLLRGIGGRPTGPSTTSSASRPRRAWREPSFTTNTLTQISNIYETSGCRAASRSCTPSRPARQLGRVPDVRRAQRVARRQGSDRLAQRPRDRVHVAHRHDDDDRRLVERPRRDDGHVVQRHPPRWRRHHRRRGPRRDRADLGDLELVRLLPREGAVRAPYGFQGEDLDVLEDAVYSRADLADLPELHPERHAERHRPRTGDYTPFWDDRDYMKDKANFHAAVAHRAREHGPATS